MSCGGTEKRAAGICCGVSGGRLRRGKGKSLNTGHAFLSAGCLPLISGGRDRPGRRRKRPGSRHLSDSDAVLSLIREGQRAVLEDGSAAGSGLPVKTGSRNTGSMSGRGQRSRILTTPIRSNTGRNVGRDRASADISGRSAAGIPISRRGKYTGLSKLPTFMSGADVFLHMQEV